MKNFPLLSEILRQDWMLEADYAERMMPLLLQMLSGTDVSPNAYKDGDESERESKAEKFKEQMGLYAGYIVPVYRSRDLTAAPEGSIAMMMVDGPMMKGDYCGDAGSMTRASLIADANKNPNITGIILKMDSPGGSVAGTQTLAAAVRDSSKPVVGYVEEGMAASAAYYVLSECDWIVCSRNLDVVGSIGVYTSFADFTKYFEDKGIKIHEIYSTLSAEKNGDFKAALKDNYKPIQTNSLDPIAKEFIAHVKAARGSKLNLRAGDPFKGATYNATQALEIGLIDEIGGFDKAVAKVQELASTKKSNQNFNSNNMKGLKATYAAIIGFLGFTVNAATNFTNEEFGEEQMTKLDAELTRLQTENASLTTAKATAETALATANTNLTTMTAERDKYAAMDGAPATVAAAKEDKPADEAKTNPFETPEDRALAKMRAEENAIPTI